MDNNVSLIYALDEFNSLKVVLMRGTQEEIDKFTLQFENSKELRFVFKDVIENFRMLNINYIESKKRVESGDIVTVNSSNTNASFTVTNTVQTGKVIVTKEIESSFCNIPSISI